jgi:PAS domain S-box-containing protein
LLAGFIAVGLFTGVLGWYAVSTMEGMNNGQHTVYEDVFGGTHLLARWVDLSWESRADLLGYLLEDDAPTQQATRDEMVTIDEHLQVLARQMDEADSDREDVGTLAALVQAWINYANWRDESVLAQYDLGNRAEAMHAYGRDGARLGAAVDETIDAFLDKKRLVGASLEAAADQSFALTRGFAILLSFGAAGLGLSIGIFVSRSIAGGVGQVATAAQGLAVGDLDQHIARDSNDEIGQMAAAVRKMIAYQQEMARAAEAIARGDLTHQVEPKAATDQLGMAFRHMTINLRTLVGQLEEAVRRANELAELAEEREARMRAVLDSVADAIITFDSNGRIETANPAAERIFGYPSADIIGRHGSLLLGAQPALELSYATRRNDATGRRQDGSVFPMDLAISEMRLGERRLSIASVRDSTERKQAEAAQRFLTEASTLLAASLDYETTLTSIARLAVPFLADGCAVEVVKEDEAPAGLTAVALVEPSGAQLSGRLGDLPAAVLASGRSYLASGGPQLQAILGDTGFAALMLVPLVAGGRTLGVISFASTESGRHYGANELSLAEELAHRCALAIENARLYREAQGAIRLRDDFFSVASHELKTPVAALLAFSQFMLKRAERQHGLTSAQMAEALEEVHWQSDRIARLVAQLLDTSRVDAGKLALEPVVTEVAALVRSAVRVVRANSNHCTISVRSAPELWATVDPLRMEQVVTNLIDNAIKYSPDGGLIEVELSRPQPRTMHLVVRDYGIGIPAEHLPYIFDRFYQAHAGQHFAGVVGMGLGLYISRRLVEMHGGTIGIDSPPDGGTRVTVTLPVGVTGSAFERRGRQARALQSSTTEQVG